ncbi:Coronatine-insensitive protein 1 [Linum perenne]
MEEHRNHEKLTRTSGTSSSSFHVGMSEVVIGCVMPYIYEQRDRGAVSLVCRKWYELDALTRKHVKISLCYTTTPDRVRRRFCHLESLKLKGKPRASMFNLVPEDWGGYLTPWVKEIAESFSCLTSVHFRRMIARDSDLELLAKSRGKALHHLKLDICSGFSTDGLLQVARFCRQLRTLFLEESSIMEKDGDWLHELATNNKVLQTLNFYKIDLVKVKAEDLELIAKNCPCLISVKINDCEILDLIGFFRAASSLQEFFGGSFSYLGEDNVPQHRYSALTFPTKLCRLGLNFMGNQEMPIVFPLAPLLKKLDLQYALLDTEGHCHLIQRCTNLEILETRNVIGDRGLEVVGRSCRRLKRLRIENGADDQGSNEEKGVVSQRGLIAVAQGCIEIEYLAAYVSDISNEALEYIGTYSKNLTDFRLALLNRSAEIADLPLDNGVRTLLRGCDKLRRFALYLRQGALSDLGMSYIGQYSENVRYMLLGYAGSSDEGLLALSKGCPSLQKLEMSGYCFSDSAVARAVLNLNSLRYLWVSDNHISEHGVGFLEMARPNWNIELICLRNMHSPSEGGETVIDHPTHLLAYYSLAGQRRDFPDTVIIPLDPPSNLA